MPQEHDKPHHLPKQVDPQPNKSPQPIVNREQEPAPGFQGTYGDTDPEVPTATYGDTEVDPETLPIASDPDPEKDPMVSRDAAAPIPTGAYDPNAPVMEEQQSAELLADPDNRRIHGRHHERHGGRPLESSAPYTKQEEKDDAIKQGSQDESDATAE